MQTPKDYARTLMDEFLPQWPKLDISAVQSFETRIERIVKKVYQEGYKAAELDSVGYDEAVDLDEWLEDTV